jgi:hypothetical protein
MLTNLSFISSSKQKNNSAPSFYIPVCIIDTVKTRLRREAGRILRTELRTKFSQLNQFLST